jgi:hypothetical protein
MSLPRARKDSNAPDSGTDNSPSTGEVAMVGFTKVDYEEFRPARANDEVASTSDNNAWDMGQDGTSVEAYEFQPEELGGQDFEGLAVASKGQGKK